MTLSINYYGPRDAARGFPAAVFNQSPTDATRFVGYVLDRAKLAVNRPATIEFDTQTGTDWANMIPSARPRSTRLTCTAHKQRRCRLCGGASSAVTGWLSHRQQPGAVRVCRRTIFRNDRNEHNMTWPPTNQPTGGKSDSTPMATDHPTEHNAIKDTLDDIIEKVDDGDLPLFRRHGHSVT